jgi:hypothetical protein
MTVKIRIKVGTIELEYEGSEEFFTAEFSNILGNIAELQASTPSASAAPDSSGNGEIPPPLDPVVVKVPLRGQEPLSVNSIAARIGGASGPDLAIAASAYIAIMGHKDVFSRKEILEWMKSGTSYYKESYGKNLTTALSSLVKSKKLIERGRDTYALPAEHKNQLEARLADRG